MKEVCAPLADVRSITPQLQMPCDAQTYFLTIIKAAITPGIQPHRVRIKTSKSEPQPLSITASGGKIIQRITRQIDIVFCLN